MDYKKYISEKLKIDGVSAEEIYDCLALPPTTEMGDYALPCFKFAKIFRKSPAAIAEELRANISPDEVISEISAVNGYLNFKIDNAVRKRSSRKDISGKGQIRHLRRGAGQDGLHRLFLHQYRQAFPYRAPFHDGFGGRSVPDFKLFGL